MPRTLLELLEDPKEGRYLVKIMNSPGDHNARQRYFEWLIRVQDPRGSLVSNLLLLPHVNDPQKRATIAAQIAELEAAQDPMWVKAVLRQGRIGNCGAAADREPAVRFSYACPLSWEKLQNTGEPTVRRCDECRREVHYCRTFDEAEQHALEGDCIAVSSRLLGQAHEKYCALVVGQPDPLARWADVLFR